MAGSLSNFAEAKILNHIVGEADWPLPTVHVGLFTADPGEAGSLTNEVADAGSYARQAVAGKWAAAASGSVEINAEITFPEATGDWGTITHFALINSGVHGSGDILVSGDLTVPKTIETGEIAKFESGDIAVTITTAAIDYRDKILDHVVGEADITDIAVWIALFVDAVEVSEAGYARVATDSDDWTTATEGAIENSGDITFPEAEADWGTINKFKLMDAVTAGAAVASGDLDNSKHIESGETAKFATGDLDMTLS